jgi:hypothetical protein
MKKHFKRAAALLVAFCAFASLLAPSAWAAKLGGSVTVTVPAFDVTLNGQKVDSAYSQYPLLVYRDITYLPMTYDGARWLGLTTSWSESAGLGVAQEVTPLAAQYNNYSVKAKNSARYTAAVASFAVAVNGKKVDNAVEKYPLLVFRGVTYFPLTWAFCVTEFGWKYSFSNEQGLVISSQVAAPADSYFDGASTWYVRNSALYTFSGKQGWPALVYELDWPTSYYSFFTDDDGNVVLNGQTSDSGITSKHYYLTIAPDGSVTDHGYDPELYANDRTLPD